MMHILFQIQPASCSHVFSHVPAKDQADGYIEKSYINHWWEQVGSLLTCQAEKSCCTTSQVTIQAMILKCLPAIAISIDSSKPTSIACFHGTLPLSQIGSRLTPASSQAEQYVSLFKKPLMHISLHFIITSKIVLCMRQCFMNINHNNYIYYICPRLALEDGNIIYTR